MTKYEIIKEIEKITGTKVLNMQHFQLSNLIQRITSGQVVYRDRYLYNDANVTKEVDYNTEAEKICFAHNIELSDLITKKRSAHLVRARVHFCRYMKKNYPQITLRNLADYLKRDHTTIVHYLYYYKGYSQMMPLNPKDYVYE